MPRLTIEHDAAGADSSPPTRRRSIALRLDGKAWLRVEPEALAELGVSDGDELDDAARAEVELSLARTRARLFVVRSLAVRMQSRAEIVKKLEARDVPPEVAKEAIDRVTGYGYLDDAALAGQLARGMRSRGYGRRRAEQKLRSARARRARLPRRLWTRRTRRTRSRSHALRSAAARSLPTPTGDARSRSSHGAAFSAGAAWAAIRRAASE